MNNNSSENVNQQVPVTSVPVTNSEPQVVQPSTLENNVATPNVVAGTQPTVIQNPQPTVSSNVQTVSSTDSVVKENQVVNSAVSDIQRVSLVDKPAIQAIVPNSSVGVNPVASSSAAENTTEVLEENPGEKEPVTPEKGSVGKTIFLILLFGGLFVMVIFLPDISSYIETQKYLSTQTEEKITTGTLECVYESSSETLDYTYSLEFDFTDSKLKKLDYVLEIRGDANLDSEELDALKTECDNLIIAAEKVGGVSISCSLSGGLYTQRQVITYASINKDDALTAYTEAGGTYPDYEKDQSIDEIEKRMNASDYTCERVK